MTAANPKKRPKFQEIGERLSSLRRRLGISQTEFANEIGVTQQGYALIEAGRRRPSAEHLIRIAQGWSLSPEEILAGSVAEAQLSSLEIEVIGLFRSYTVEERRRAIDVLRRLKEGYQPIPETRHETAAERVVPYNEPPARELRPLSLYRVAAGRGLEPIETYDELEQTEREQLDPDLYFALRVEGDSMTGSDIHHGDVVLVKRTDAAQKRKIMVVENTVEQTAVIKLVADLEPDLVLRSTNPDRAQYPDLHWRVGVRIKGVFIRVLRR